MPRRAKIGNSRKLHFKREFLPIDDHNQALISQIRTLFSIFKKGQVDLQPSPSTET